MTSVVLRTIYDPVLPARCVVCGQAWNKHVPVLVERTYANHETQTLKHIAVPVCKTCRPRFRSTQWPEGCVFLPVLGFTAILSGYLFRNVILQRLFLYVVGFLFFVFTKRQIEKLRALDIAIEYSTEGTRFKFANEEYAKEFAEMNRRHDNLVSVEVETKKPFQFHLFTLFALTIVAGIEIPLVIWIVNHVKLESDFIFGIILFCLIPPALFGATIEAFLREAERQRRWPNK